MTSRERAVRAYASQHRSYLRAAHPTVWRAMVDAGTIRRHCRRRAVDVWAMRERLSETMHRQAYQRGGSAAEIEAIPIVVDELVSEDLRSL